MFWLQIWISAGLVLAVLIGMLAVSIRGRILRAHRV
jgi:hypothetical protein